MDEHKGKWEFQTKKMKFLNLFLKLWVHVTEIPFQTSIHFLLVVGCTLLISSAEAERSFSLMRRIKIYARSVMTEERFFDLALISMHYKERVPVDEICKAFVQAHPR